jgi:ribosomal protein L7Ae-like RNA K-turn-binding protein
VEARTAQLAVMAQDCDQPDYTKLVQALCTEANVNLITVPASKTLGEWCGLCKLDAEGLARKVVGCSFVVIKARKACGAARELALGLTRGCARRITGRSPRRWASFRST